MRRSSGAVASVLVLGAALLSGCVPQDNGGCPVCPRGAGRYPTVLMLFDTIAHGAHSGVPAERRLVIRDAATWEALWAEHVAEEVPPPSVPPVDFTREMVIAFFWGQKPTSGYEVETTEIAWVEDRIVVRVQESSPRPEDMVLQVLTQPHHIVQTPRVDLPVEFVVVPAPREGVQKKR